MSYIGVPLCSASKHSLKWFLHNGVFIFFFLLLDLITTAALTVMPLRLAPAGVWVTVRRASFLLKTVFCWRILDLQCCVTFCSAAKWCNYICILVHILSHYGLSQDIEYGSLCYTVGLFLFGHPVYNSLHLLISNSPSFPLPLPTPWQPQGHSLMSVSLFLLCR